ncbi:hypothetical protein [Psychromicrobium xiongbiense]|uniref:hypothetical protein n=1 Tax=Psychromicrobium xiongbiense TaxID=3051184 RepID=UPI002552375C|nr:hypothetical protein [Psychromicrobium sp. YIM S02556]
MAVELYLGRSSLPYLSSLRLYLPLEDFAPEVQGELLRLTTPESPRIETELEELTDALRRLPGTLPYREFVRTFRAGSEHLLLYNPSQSSLRTQQALKRLGSSGSRGLAEMVIGEAVVASATASEEDSEALTRTSAWGVPFSWFVLFSSGARVEETWADDQLISARALTAWADARTRLTSAIELLSRTDPEWDLLDELTSLSRWMDQGHEGAAVELDYGAIATLVWPDESPLDVQLGLEAIAEGDLTTAAAAYRRLATRWIPVRQHGSAS